MTIITVGIDLAKNVFSVHGVDENGQVVLQRTVRCDQLLEMIATLPRPAAASWIDCVTPYEPFTTAARPKKPTVIGPSGLSISTASATLPNWVRRRGLPF